MVSALGPRTPRRLCALAVAALPSACFPSFEVGEAGTDAALDRSAADRTTECSDQEVDCAPADAPGGHEAATDAGRCIPVEVLPEPAHGGPACPMDGSACFPGSVMTFSPAWIPPVIGAPYANECSAKQIADGFSNCFGPSATTTGCMSWEGTNPACLKCMVTESTAARYGPVIYYDNGGITLTLLNVAGCIALAEPCNLPCAEAILADLECDLAACSTASGPCSTATTSEVVNCISEADFTCGCTGYHASQNCFLNLVQNHPSSHPAVSLCNLAGTEGFTQDNFTAVVSLMCGPPPPG
jgi:hypothetical protein